MASLSSQFKSSPQTFIMTHSYLVLIGGDPNNPNFQTGTGNFQFVDANTGPGTCFLQEKPRLTLIDYFSAFLLTADPDSHNSHALPNDVDRFVTSDMHGCQLLAYGADRNNLTVEHNNYITTPANYAIRYNLIAGQGHNILIAFRPVNNAAPGADEYHYPHAANVVGLKRADGWHFFARTKTTQHFGPTREL